MIQVNKITNPGAVTTGTYLVTTTDSNDQAYQISAAIAASTIVSTTLTPATTVPDSLNGGVVGTATVTFTTSVGLPVGAKVKITFPSDYGVASDAIGSVSNINAGSSVSASSQVVTVVVATTAVTASSAVSFTVKY